MDNLGILVQAILSLKDTTSSKNQIAKELPKLESQLQSDKNTRVKIVAGLDIAKSKNLIQSQLNTLANQAKAPAIKIGIDTSGLNSVQGATQNITNGLKNVQTQAQQTAKSVHDISTAMSSLKFPVATKYDADKNLITDTVKSIQNARDMFNKMGFNNLEFKWVDEAGGVFDRLKVKVTDAYGAVQEFKFLNNGSSYIYDGASGTDSGVEKLIQSMQKAQDKLKALRTDLASTLKSVGNGYSDPNAVKPIVDDTHLKNLNTQYVHALRSIADLKNADDTTMASMKANAESEIEKLKQMVKQYQNAEYAATSLRTKDIGTIKTNQTNELNEFIAQINRSKVPIDTMTKDIEELKTALNGIGDKDSLTKFLNQFDNAKSKFESVKATYQSIADKIKELQRIQNSGTFNKNSSDSTVINLKQQITALLTEYEKLKTQLNGNVTPQGLTDIGNQLTQLNAHFNDATNTAKRFETELRSDNGAEQLSQKVALLTQRIKAYRQANSKSEKMFGSQYDSMLSQLANPNIDLNAYNAINKQFQTMRQEINATNAAGKTLWQTLKEKAGKFVGWMSLTGIISSIWREMQQMVTNVIELDSAMTNLKKVTDETDATYSRFLKNASQQAKELHSTVTDLIEQTSQWAKLGYNLEQANKLAEASMIYANVGEVDNEQAVTNIVSAVKAFDIAVDDIMSIPDVYNKLGNEFAVSSKNLGVGMSQAATTMALAGNDFNQVAALLTGAGEILGDNRLDEIGTGLKTVTLRIQNQAGALKELGEEYEDLVSVSKTQQQIYELTGGKVNIMSATDPNEFRDTYNILKDVANVINDLNGTDASELVQLLFGKNRANVGTAILKAFQSGQIEKAYEAAKNSAGSAQEEFDRWSQSIEAHINTFKASFESLSQTILDSDLIKFVVDFGTTTLNTLDNIISKFGTIPTLLGSIATASAFKNVGGLINTPPYAPLQLCA